VSTVTSIAVSVEFILKFIIFIIILNKKRREESTTQLSLVIINLVIYYVTGKSAGTFPAPKIVRKSANTALVAALLAGVSVPLSTKIVNTFFCFSTVGDCLSSKYLICITL